MSKNTRAADLNILDESKIETERVVEARGLPRTKYDVPNGSTLPQGVRLAALVRVDIAYPERLFGRFAALDGERERQRRRTG